MIQKLRIRLLDENLHEPIHHYLMSVIPLLMFINANKLQMSLRDPVIEMLIGFFLLLSIGTFIGMIILFRDKLLSAVASTWVMFYMLSYGRFHDLLHNIEIQTPFMTIGPDKILIAVMLTGLFVLLMMRIFNYTLIKKFSVGLNLMACILLLITSVSLVKYDLFNNSAFIVETGVDRNEQSERVLNDNVDEKLPDIYYIVPDAHPSIYASKEYLDYDVSWFGNGLREKGFIVDDEAYANYPHTHLSLPSTLNMKYLNYLEEEYGQTEGDYAVVYDMIQNNATFQHLKDMGYTFYFFPNYWTPMTENPNADVVLSGDVRYLKKGPFFIVLNEFAETFLKTTFAKDYISNQVHDGRRGSILYVFDKLKDVARAPGPKVVFAHLILPHPPYLFGPAGEIVPESVNTEGDSYADKEHLRDQMIFTASKLQETALAILDNSESEPVIIIQSDHGSPTEFGDPDNWTETTIENDIYGIRERMSILRAIYVPEEYREDFSDIGTPVNTFRVLFSSVFGMDYPKLDDEYYFMYDILKYRFTDVTKEFKSLKLN